MSAIYLRQLASLSFMILAIAACSSPPSAPASGGGAVIESDNQNVAGSFNAAAFFSSTCADCHAGENPVRVLMEVGDYDGDYLEGLSFLESHARVRDRWPEGDNAEALADYINEDFDG